VRESEKLKKSIEKGIITLYMLQTPKKQLIKGAKGHL
jgi:hypothetical protein